MLAYLKTVIGQGVHILEKIIPLIILYSDVQTTFNGFTDSVCTADCTAAIITTNSTGTGKGGDVLQDCTFLRHTASHTLEDCSRQPVSACRTARSFSRRPVTPCRTARSFSRRPVTPCRTARYFSRRPVTPCRTARSFSRRPVTPCRTARSFSRRPVTGQPGQTELRQKVYGCLNALKRTVPFT